MVQGFNHVQISRFFDNLVEIYQKYGFKSEQIFNVDETDVSTVPDQKLNLISPKGNIYLLLYLITIV